MVKIAWLLIIAHYSVGNDRLMWSETHYLETKEKCELYERMDRDALMQRAGVRIEHIMTECIQVVVPEGN